MTSVATSFLLLPPEGVCGTMPLKSSFSNKTRAVGSPAVHNAAIKNQVGSPPLR